MQMFHVSSFVEDQEDSCNPTVGDEQSGQKPSKLVYTQPVQHL